MNGLASCIVIIIRSVEPMPEKQYDKILAHIASTVCLGGENLPLETQMQNLFALDAMPIYQIAKSLSFPDLTAVT